MLLNENGDLGREDSAWRVQEEGWGKAWGRPRRYSSHQYKHDLQGKHFSPT